MGEGRRGEFPGGGVSGGVRSASSPAALAAAGVALVALLAAGCVDAAGPDAGLASFQPVWITASWTGGAAGAPNDRTDREPATWKGRLCPASSVQLTNHSGGFAGLNIVNRCTITVTYGLCATKGNPPQPQFGLPECAQDALQTPLGSLKIITLNPGPLGDFVNATPQLSIQVFYCGDETTLTGAPVRCLGIG